MLGLVSGPHTILIHFSMNTLFNYNHARLTLSYGRFCNIRLNLIKLTVDNLYFERRSAAGRRGAFFTGYSVAEGRKTVTEKISSRDGF